MPKQILVTVGPGDLGRKFFFAENVDGANNRTIDPLRVAMYKKSLSTLNIHPLVLLERENDTFVVGDGQHRIKAVSEAATAPIPFQATLWTLEEIHAMGLNFPGFLKLLNSGKKFSGADKLSVYQSSSPWLPIFEGYKLKPSFSQKRTNHIWTSVVRARIIADGMQAVGKVAYIKATDDVVLESFRNCEAWKIDNTAKTLVWWQDGVNLAESRGVSAMTNANVLAIAICVAELNVGHEGLVGAPLRLAKSDDIFQIGRVGGHSFITVLGKHMLRGLNYRRTTHVLSIFGENGRERGME